MTEPETKKRRIAVADTKDVILRHQDLGPLHDLLLKACPASPDGVKSVHVLATKLGISRWAVHKWVGKGKIPPGRAVEVVDLSSGRVTLADFSPFIYV